MNGAERIAAERRRQLEEEDFTPEHDSQQVHGELPLAAISYLRAALGRVRWLGGLPENWPWHRAWWKPSDDPIRNLEKAGALIAAEIDRLLAAQGEKT